MSWDKPYKYPETCAEGGYHLAEDKQSSNSLGLTTSSFTHLLQIYNTGPPGTLAESNIFTHLGWIYFWSDFYSYRATAGGMMKGHFSIEWLSQSSQVPYNSEAINQSSSWISTALDRPSTSGTVPESLPGFYSRRADNIGNQWIQSEPVGPTQSFNNTTKQETRMNNAVTLHHVPESGFSSGTEEEETSGYESEGGRSLSPMASKEPAPSTSPGTGRRARTAFTAEQIESLERAFKRNAYLGAQDKAELCKRLNLSDKQIRNWFQNRRMKLKRTVQDALAHACQANVASQLMHYPELQSYRPAPYPTYYPAQESPATYLCPPNIHYTPSVVPTLPANTLYQYRCPQGLPMAPSSQALMQPYQPYPHQYFGSQ